MDKITEYLEIAQEKIIFFAPKILLAIVILWIGFKIIKKLVKLFEIALEKGGMSANIRRSIANRRTGNWRCRSARGKPSSG